MRRGRKEEARLGLTCRNKQTQKALASIHYRSPPSLSSSLLFTLSVIRDLVVQPDTVTRSYFHPHHPSLFCVQFLQASILSSPVLNPRWVSRKDICKLAECGWVVWLVGFLLSFWVPPHSLYLRIADSRKPLRGKNGGSWMQIGESQSCRGWLIPLITCTNILLCWNVKFFCTPSSGVLRGGEGREIRR